MTLYKLAVLFCGRGIGEGEGGVDAGEGTGRVDRHESRGSPCCSVWLKVDNPDRVH